METKEKYKLLQNIHPYKEGKLVRFIICLSTKNKETHGVSTLEKCEKMGIIITISCLPHGGIRGHFIAVNLHVYRYAMSNGGDSGETLIKFVDSPAHTNSLDKHTIVRL